MLRSTAIALTAALVCALGAVSVAQADPVPSATAQLGEVGGTLGAPIEWDIVANPTLQIQVVATAAANWDAGAVYDGYDWELLFSYAGIDWDESGTLSATQALANDGSSSYVFAGDTGAPQLLLADASTPGSLLVSQAAYDDHDLKSKPLLGIAVLTVADQAAALGGTRSFTITGGQSTLVNGGTESLDIDPLTVTLTPEPATLSLLGLGGIALLRRRRR